MITRKELRRIRKGLEACPKRPRLSKQSRKYAIAKHNSKGFKVEYKNRTYVAGYNTAKG